MFLLVMYVLDTFPFIFLELCLLPYVMMLDYIMTSNVPGFSISLAL